MNEPSKTIALHFILISLAIFASYIIGGYGDKNVSDFLPTATIAATCVAAFMASYNSAVVASKTRQHSYDYLINEKRLEAGRLLISSSLRYYRTLAPLETGNIDFGTVETAECEMRNTEEKATGLLSDQMLSTWTSFWHDARKIKEDALSMNAAQRKDLWRKELKKLDAKLSVITDDFKAAFPWG